MIDFSDVKPPTAEEQAQAEKAWRKLKADERRALDKLRDANNCARCEATFLIGADDAKLNDAAHHFGFCYEPGDLYCFFCWDQINYDPYDPEPSRFQYGHC